MLGLFSVMLNIQDDVEDSSNNRVGNDMGCAMIDCTENNNRLLFFVTVMFFVCVLVIISVMNHLADHFWLDLMISFS